MKKVIIGIMVLGVVYMNIGEVSAGTDCEGVRNLDNINVFACQFQGGVTVIPGSAYWIRMSIGYEVENGQAAAIADKPNISLPVTMNDVPLAIDGDTVVEYNDGTEFWEINSYYCTGILSPGVYTIVGTQYRNNDDYIGSATCALTVTEPLTVSPNCIVLTVGETKDIMITGGTPPYNVYSSDTSIATATLNDNTVSVKGVSPECNRISISDNSYFFMDVSVTVLSDNLYSSVQLDQAVAEAEAAKDQIIAQKDQTIDELNTTIDSMFTQEQLDQAIINERQKWDINNDAKISLEEAIYTLQIISGLRH